MITHLLKQSTDAELELYLKAINEEKQARHNRDRLAEAHRVELSKQEKDALLYLFKPKPEERERSFKEVIKYILALEAEEAISRFREIRDKREFRGLTFSSLMARYKQYYDFHYGNKEEANV